MEEVRSCETCEFSKIDCNEVGVCMGFDKWQPIHKAPSFQTEGESR